MLRTSMSTGSAARIAQAALRPHYTTTAAPMGAGGTSFFLRNIASSSSSPTSESNDELPLEVATEEVEILRNGEPPKSDVEPPPFDDSDYIGGGISPSFSFFILH
jgi:K+-transporting ATPase c subunit